MLEPHVSTRADSPGAQPSWRHRGKLGPVSLSNLPRDVILGVLDEICSVGPLTTPESTADKPMVSPDYLNCRSGLLNICLASRTFYELAIPHLYRKPLIKNRRELFQFFCAIATRADRRFMVRSFAWAGVMWEAHTDAESSARHLEEEAATLAQCWHSIKNAWPRDCVDLEIAKLSEYENLIQIALLLYSRILFHIRFLHKALFARPHFCQIYCTRIPKSVNLSPPPFFLQAAFSKISPISTE